MIKCNNVQEQAQDLSGQIFARWQELLQSGDFILGDEVLAFEAWMSGRCGGAHAVALNSGNVFNLCRRHCTPKGQKS